MNSQDSCRLCVTKNSIQSTLLTESIVNILNSVTAHQKSRRVCQDFEVGLTVYKVKHASLIGDHLKAAVLTEVSDK